MDERKKTHYLLLYTTVPILYAASLLLKKTLFLITFLVKKIE